MIEEKKKDSMFLSLRTKLLVLFITAFSIIFASAYYWFFTYSTQTAMARVEEDLLATLNGAIARIDGDKFQMLVNRYGYKNLANVPLEQRKGGFPLPENDPDYVDHQKWLNTIHTIEPRANPYTYVPGFDPDGEILFVGDFLRMTQPDNSTLFLQPYTTVTNMVKGFKDVTYNGEIYSDDWGSWVSAYGPIKNSAGQVVGALGIDFRADYVYQVQAEVRNSTIIAFIITIAVLFLVVTLIAGIFTYPIIKLTRAAEHVGEGDYDQDFSAMIKKHLPDETDILATVFMVMVLKVRKREQKLIQQVEMLRIEVDESKRQKQVSEIVETDFFRELQDKAHQIRERRSRKEK